MGYFQLLFLDHLLYRSYKCMQVSEDNIMQVWLMAENIYNDQEIDVSEDALETSQ